MRSLAVLLMLLPMAAGPMVAGAQAITATPLAPPPVPRSSIYAPSELGPLSPVVRSPVVRPPPGPAARKVRRTVKPAAHPAPAHPAAVQAARPVVKPPAVVVAPPAPPPVLAVTPPPPKPDPNKGTATGLPLPRWAALRSDEVNLRAGPGMDRPIDWQYHRRDLPVKIEREYEVWRLVEDQDGTKGWVHQAVLTGRRGFVVTGDERVLRSGASDTADPVARLKPGVVGVIRGCAAGNAWCEVKTGGYQGWLKRADVYGVDANEVVAP